jgi:hypothetical protein
MRSANSVTMRRDRSVTLLIEDKCFAHGLAMQRGSPSAFPSMPSTTTVGRLACRRGGPGRSMKAHARGNGRGEPARRRGDRSRPEAGVQDWPANGRKREKAVVGSSSGSRQDLTHARLNDNFLDRLISRRAPCRRCRATMTCGDAERRLGNSRPSFALEVSGLLEDELVRRPVREHFLDQIAPDILLLKASIFESPSLPDQLNALRRRSTSRTP